MALVNPRAATCVATYICLYYTDVVQLLCIVAVQLLKCNESVHIFVCMSCTELLLVVMFSDVAITKNVRIKRSAHFIQAISTVLEQDLIYCDISRPAEQV